MKLNNVLTTSRSICIELENDFPYYNNEGFKITINNEPFAEDYKKNIVSFFDLKPETNYAIMIGETVIEVMTLVETQCLNVKDFSAVGDGIKDDTSAFQAAIMAANKNACIYVDKGIYLIKPLFLKSDITIYLAKDAKILGDINRENYPILPGIINGEVESNLGTWEGEEVECFASLITGINICNVNIVGEGIIDCQSTLGDWYQNHRVKRGAWRPFGVFLNRCNNISLHGITVCNTPSWNIHPYFSRDLNFIDIKLMNPHDMPTTDGIDPDFCHNVNIIGVYISVGDDCIAIKSGQFEMAKKYQECSKNIEIRNCLMEHGHGGVVFGSESSGGIQNVRVSKCIFNKTDRGLRIKTRRGRGRIGIIDNVIFENIIMDAVMTPFVVNMFYNMGPVGGHDEYVWTTKKLQVTEETPLIGHFHFKNMTCINISLAAGVFLGLPEEPIKGITLENIVFEYDLNATQGYPVMIEHKIAMKRAGLILSNVDEVELINVIFKNQLGEELVMDNVKQIKRR